MSSAMFVSLRGVTSSACERRLNAFLSNIDTEKTQPTILGM